MVKECLVLKTNDVVTVVKFGNTLVQIPSIHSDAKTVRINFKNGKYFVVDENYKENIIDANYVERAKKNNSVKKTTIEDGVIQVEEDSMPDVV